MQNDFILFDNILNDQSIKLGNDNMCKHPSIDKHNKCCKICGVEINDDIFFNQEMSAYSNNNRKFNNPSRCHARKSQERTIYKDLSNLNIPDNIIKEANILYQHVVQDRIYRGNTRKAIIFACIFYAYKKAGLPQSCDTLTNLFNIDRKDGLHGLKIVNLHTNNTIVPKSTYITPTNIITEIMHKFSAEEQDTKNVIELYNRIYKKSELLNRARPQSIASGLIRYYIIKNNKNIPIETFLSIVNISELTINRIVKEISKILDS